jgi:hypothetical protein
MFAASCRELRAGSPRSPELKHALAARFLVK